MKKLLGIVILGLLLSGNVYSETVLFLNCKADNTINLKTGENSATAGQFTFKINREKEVKTLNGSQGLIATRSDSNEIYYGSSDDDSFNFQGFMNLEDPELLFIYQVTINRINGQMKNYVQGFKDISKKKEEDREKPDAQLVHYSSCEVAKKKF